MRRHDVFIDAICVFLYEQEKTENRWGEKNVVTFFLREGQTVMASETPKSLLINGVLLLQRHSVFGYTKKKNRNKFYPLVLLFGFGSVCWVFSSGENDISARKNVIPEQNSSYKKFNNKQPPMSVCFYSVCTKKIEKKKKKRKQEKKGEKLLAHCSNILPVILRARALVP